MATQEGLGDAQGGGRAGEAAKLGHAHKGFNLLEVHPNSQVYLPKSYAKCL
jgi:hypothetical protein